MRYLKFCIENFKGIKKAEIDLRSTTGANVFCLVGLNESGKTTILEAIHSFSPDYRTRTLRRAAPKAAADAAKERLPRHLLAHFTGEIIVEATAEVSDLDKQGIVDLAKADHDLIIDINSVPTQFSLRRSDRFERGDYVDSPRYFDFEVIGRRKGERKDRPLSQSDRDAFWHCLWNHTPDIAYHDSFIFDFPKRIYLTQRAGVDNWVYSKMFEDVLAAGRVSYTIADITRRIRNENYKRSWIDFFSAWSENDDKGRVQQIIDQASETITKTVFGKWNKIFHEEVGDKEIVVQYGVEKGRSYDKTSQTYFDSDEHDLWISLEIKHGTRRFPIQDRSLGFRWFLAFLLFTQFRAVRNEDRPILFLFDEPAANLHSAAQARLIESFPDIATRDNMLLYTTHSHYMISPDWLEQTFIVTNAADAPGTAIVDTAVIEDEALDIKAQLYRSFVNEHPSETSYFQPIVDRLDVQPSRFDISLPSVVVEGKSDYYTLRYAIELLGEDELRLLPAAGSGSFEALVAIGATWGTKFLFVLDSDSSGLKERSRYALDHGARSEAIVSLGDFVDGLIEIEGLLDGEARTIVSARLGVPRLTKKAIARYFQEQLAKREVLELGSAFEERARRLIRGLREALNSL